MNLFYSFSPSMSTSLYAPTIMRYDEYRVPCICGSQHQKKAFEAIDVIIEGKGLYPDFLFCGHYPLLIVSDRVLNLWNENEVNGFRSHQVRLFRNEGVEIPQTEASYHNIVITGRNSLDFEQMGIRVVSQCPKCGYTKYNKKTWEFGQLIVNDNAWDGSDLFVFERFEASPLCGLKNLKIIYENRLTKVSIKQVDYFFNGGVPDLNLKEYIKENNLNWKRKKT